MGKKKSISALVSGIMGQPEEKLEQEAPASSAVSAGTPGQSPDAAGDVRRGRGRPKNAVREMRVTNVMHPDVVRKIKYIAWKENRMQKDILDEALRGYIGKWEMRNGVIEI